MLFEVGEIYFVLFIHHLAQKLVCATSTFYIRSAINLACSANYHMDKVESIEYHTVGTYNRRIVQTPHAHIHGLGVSTVVLWAHIIVVCWSDNLWNFWKVHYIISVVISPSVHIYIYFIIMKFLVGVLVY